MKPNCNFQKEYLPQKMQQMSVSCQVTCVNINAHLMTAPHARPTFTVCCCNTFIIEQPLNLCSRAFSVFQFSQGSVAPLVR